MNELVRTALARAANVKLRLVELRARDFPTDTARQLSVIIGELVAAIEARLQATASPLDDVTAKFACNVIAQLGSHLRYIEGATSSRIPMAIIEPVEQLISSIVPGARVLLRVQWTLNYKVFDILAYYRRMFQHLLPAAQLTSIFGGTSHFYIVSVPSVENSNAMLHPLIGHEFGHRLAEQFLAAEDQNQLLASVKARVGDLSWWVPSVSSLPQHFKLPMIQSVFNAILNARKRALQELISDFVGYFLFGPSLIFAASSFASSQALDTLPEERNNFYPPWRYRIRELLKLSERDDLVGTVRALTGEDPLAEIRDRAIDHLAELQAIAADTSDVSVIESSELLKRAYVDIGAVLKKVPAFLEAELGSVRYSPLLVWAEVPLLIQRCALGLPPDDCDGHTPDFRSAISAGWLFKIARLAIPHSADGRWKPEDDETNNRLVLKAIESIQLKKSFGEWQSKTGIC